MPRNYLTGWLLAWLFCAPTWASPLSLVSTSWPPFSDQTLENNGLAIELVSTALRRAGYASEYIEVPWARAISGLQHGTYDIVATAWYAPEREVYGQFSAPYLVNRIRFLRQKGSRIDYQQLSDLRPYQIAVERGFAYAPVFDTDSSLHKVVVNDFDLALRMLAAGRVQLALEDELVAQYHLNGQLRDVREQVEFLPKPLSETPLHILVRRSHPQHEQIIEAFNAAIQAMQQDGSYDEIVLRHIQLPSTSATPASP